MPDYKFYISSFIFLLVFATSACRKDHIGQDEQYGREVNVKLQLALSMSGAEPANSSPRASEERATEDELDGTLFENKITSLTVFVIDYNETASELDWTKVNHVNIISPVSASVLDIEIKTTTGQKYIYVGANMTGLHISSFYSSKGVFTSNGNTYSDVISDFVHSARGITMFGQMFTETTLNSGDFDNPVFEITGSNTETDPIVTKLELSRVVSKVALTYTNSDAPDPNPDPDAKLAPGIGGSIKIRNVYFMLNNTSKSIDFISGMDTDNSRYLMEEYLAYNPGNSFNPLLYSYNVDPVKNFMIYAPGSTVPGQTIGDVYGVKPILLPLETSGYPYHSNIGGLEKYVGVIGGKHKHYNSFLYCLENTINTDAVLDKVPDMRHGINTKVVVAAKYTPGEVIHAASTTTDPGDSPLTITSETDFDAKTANDPNGQGTFYAVRITANTYKFYTYNAKTYLENHPPTGGIPEFITYKGGYGYYATFISQPDKDDAAEIAKDENYNLYRNNYHILNVTEFSPPGVVYPHDAYILVNSETTAWEPGKETTVIVE